MAPYRELTFTIGSPIVFHTAPPHPASNARITWPAVFVGGPLASQNGFGDSSPQNFTRRSAMRFLQLAQITPLSCRSHAAPLPEPRIDSTRSGHAFGHRVHHFLAAVGAISRRKILRIPRLMELARNHRSVRSQFDPTRTSEELRYRFLSDGAHHHVHFDGEFTPRNCFRLSFSFCIGG